MNMQILPYSPEHYPAVIRFAGKTWPNRPVSEAFLRWRYLQQPGLEGQIVLIRDEVVAMVMAVRRPWYVRGVEVERLETFDWYAAPEHVGAGYGVWAMQRLMRQGTPIVATEASAQACGFLARMRWTIVPRAAYLTLPLRWAPVRPKLSLPEPVHAVAGALFDQVAPRLARVLATDLSAGFWATSIESETAATYYAQLTERNRAHGTQNRLHPQSLGWLLEGQKFGFNITAEAIFWRHELVGIAVMRLIPTATGTRVHILGLLTSHEVARPEREVALRWMIGHVLKMAVDRSAETVHMMTSDPMIIRMLQHRGFQWTSNAPVMFSAKEDYVDGDDLFVDMLQADLSLLPYPAR